ncbi:MAG: peptide chain release factor 2 [Acidimicrobiales bacterium]|nr:MAG: peptide chain release factor 2 [Acidimicrobiales bacterium]
MITVASLEEAAREVRELRERVESARAWLDVEELERKRDSLQEESTRPDLWDDPERARQVTKQLAMVNEDLETFGELHRLLEDVETLVELAREEGEDSLLPEIVDGMSRLERRLDEVEMRTLLSGEYDERDAICEIHAGEGGTDAQDWAEMLLRAYLRWAERNGYEVEIDEVSEGQEAGITSATFVVKGRYAFGRLRGEQGTHRLVRISPFNAQGKRQTAFAALTVIPFIEEDQADIEIAEEDIRIDRFRSSGAGGQHVNVTDSAVRITHKPTGIVVTCQNERSQHQNLERAMQILKAKLADLERKKREEEISQIVGEKQRVGFGTQIRSYVLHPYQMVKDLRTGVEVGNVEAVLDGDLDRFMDAYLQWERSRKSDDGERR